METSSQLQLYQWCFKLEQKVNELQMEVTTLKEKQRQLEETQETRALPQHMEEALRTMVATNLRAIQECPDERKYAWMADDFIDAAGVKESRKKNIRLYLSQYCKGLRRNQKGQWVAVKRNSTSPRVKFDMSFLRLPKKTQPSGAPLELNSTKESALPTTPATPTSTPASSSSSTSPASTSSIEKQPPPPPPDSLRRLHGDYWLDDDVITQFFSVLKGINFLGTHSLQISHISKPVIDLKSAMTYMASLFERNHFSLAVVRPWAREAFEIDPLTGIKPLRGHLYDLWQLPTDFTIDNDFPQDFPRQTNDYDCGVYVCLLGACFAKDVFPTFDILRRSSKELRDIIYQSIKAGELVGFDNLDLMNISTEIQSPPGKWKGKAVEVVDSSGRKTIRGKKPTEKEEEIPKEPVNETPKIDSSEATQSRRRKGTAETKPVETKTVEKRQSRKRKPDQEIPRPQKRTRTQEIPQPQNTKEPMQTRMKSQQQMPRAQTRQKKNK